MTNEDIERKCLEYSQAATPSYTNGTFDRYAIAQAYEDGAEWRINSVWHKPSAYGEELKGDVEVIAKTKRGFRFEKFDVVGYSNEYRLCKCIRFRICAFRKKGGSKWRSLRLQGKYINA